jgi:hypothetical protein
LSVSAAAAADAGLRLLVLWMDSGAGDLLSSRLGVSRGDVFSCLREELRSYLRS